MFSSGIYCAASEQGQAGLVPSQEEVERKPEQSQQLGPTAPRAQTCWPPPFQLCSEGSRTTGYEVWGGVRVANARGICLQTVLLCLLFLLQFQIRFLSRKKVFCHQKKKFKRP